MSRLVVDELLARMMRCECHSEHTPLCAECEYLLALVSALPELARLWFREDTP